MPCFFVNGWWEKDTNFPHYLSLTYLYIFFSLTFNLNPHISDNGHPCVLIYSLRNDLSLHIFVWLSLWFISAILLDKDPISKSFYFTFTCNFSLRFHWTKIPIHRFFISPLNVFYICNFTGQISLLKNF